MDYVKYAGQKLYSATKYAGEHAVMGAAVAVAKFATDKYAATKVVDFIGHTFAVLPKLTVGGLSVSAFGLGALVSLVSDIAINNKRTYWNLHLTSDKDDGKKEKILKPLGKFFFTVLTGAVLTAAAAFICTGTLTGLAGAAFTGAGIGAATYTAKKVSDYVYDKAYFYKTNTFINMNIEKEVKKFETKSVDLKVEGTTLPIDLVAFLSKGDDDTIMATLPNKSEKEDVREVVEVKGLKVNALTAIDKEINALESRLDLLDSDKNKLLKDVYSEVVEGTKFADKKNKVNAVDLEPFTTRINALKAARVLWGKIAE